MKITEGNCCKAAIKHLYFGQINYKLKIDENNNIFFDFLESDVQLPQIFKQSFFNSIAYTSKPSLNIELFMNTVITTKDNLEFEILGVGFFKFTKKILKFLVRESSIFFSSDYKIYKATYTGLLNENNEIPLNFKQENSKISSCKINFKIESKKFSSISFGLNLYKNFSPIFVSNRLVFTSENEKEHILGDKFNRNLKDIFIRKYENEAYLQTIDNMFYFLNLKTFSANFLFETKDNIVKVVQDGNDLFVLTSKKLFKYSSFKNEVYDVKIPEPFRNIIVGKRLIAVYSFLNKIMFLCRENISKFSQGAISTKFDGFFFSGDKIICFERSIVKSDVIVKSGNIEVKNDDFCQNKKIEQPTILLHEIMRKIIFKYYDDEKRKKTNISNHILDHAFSSENKKEIFLTQELKYSRDYMSKILKERNDFDFLYKEKIILEKKELSVRMRNYMIGVKVKLQDDIKEEKSDVSRKKISRKKKGGF